MGASLCCKGIAFSCFSLRHAENDRNTSWVMIMESSHSMLNRRVSISFLLLYGVLAFFFLPYFFYFAFCSMSESDEECKP